MTRMISEMSAKHVELLKEGYPRLSNLAVLQPEQFVYTRQRQGGGAWLNRYRFKFVR